MSSFLLFVRKEVLVELRGKEVFVFLGGTSILFSLVTSLGIEAAFVSPLIVQKLFPSCIWSAFVCAGTVAVGRSMNYEFRGDPIVGITVTGASLESLFLAKLLVLSLMLLLVFAAIVALAGVLLAVPFGSSFGPLLIAAYPGILAFGALSLLTSAMTEGGRGRNLLLPLILLPLVIPVFAISMENSHQVYTQGLSPSEVSGAVSAWLIALLYVVVGVGLFPRIIRG